jgi:hypothetical protein
MSMSKSSVSLPRRKLIEIMQSRNFGRFEGLFVCNREPVLDPLPRIIREIKASGENGSRSEIAVNDFLLKSQVVELFQFFDKLGNGLIEVLEFKHGLPFRWFVVDAAA